MKEPTRYKVTQADCGPYIGMVADTLGRWVKFEDYRRDLAEVERLTRERKTMCEDWAHDHTEMQNKVRQFVPGADVEGDSYGVPDILDLADILTMYITILTRERDEAKNLAREVFDKCRNCKHRDKGGLCSCCDVFARIGRCTRSLK